LRASRPIQAYRKPDSALASGKALIAGGVVPVKPAGPVIAYFGVKDVKAPPIMAKLYREQMCKLGGNVAPDEADHPGRLRATLHGLDDRQVRRQARARRPCWRLTPDNAA
jgi:hypothetical protein